MLTAYVFCLAVGGSFLALSLFGDFLDGELDLDVDGEIDASGAGSAASKLLSLRTIVYAAFGFGATGTLLHLLGVNSGLTAFTAVGTGVASGVLISVAFRLLKRGESGDMPGDDTLIGLPGKVVLAVGPESAGEVRVQREGRRRRLRAVLADEAESSTLVEGRAVVVIDVKDGIVLVSPVDDKLLTD